MLCPMLDGARVTADSTYVICDTKGAQRHSSERTLIIMVGAMQDGERVDR